MRRRLTSEEWSRVFELQEREAFNATVLFGSSARR